MPIKKDYSDDKYKDQNKWEVTEYNAGMNFNINNDIDYENIYEGDLNNYNQWMKDHYLKKLNSIGTNPNKPELYTDMDKKQEDVKWYDLSNHNEMMTRNKNFTIKGEPYYIRYNNIKCNSHGDFPTGSKIKIFNQKFTNKDNKYLYGTIVKFDPSIAWEEKQGSKPKNAIDDDLYSIKWFNESKNHATGDVTNVHKNNLKWRDGKPPMHIFINNDNLIINDDKKNFGLIDNIIKNQSDINNTALIGSLSKPEKALAFFLIVKKTIYTSNGTKMDFSRRKKYKFKRR